MAKWVEWDICVEHGVVFLRLGLLWGLTQNVLYLDNYAMPFNFFEHRHICVPHSIFLEIFVSEIIYFIHQIVVIVQSVWHLLSLTSKANNCLHRWRPIFLWVKPFGCEKLNKKDFKTPNSCFDIFVFRFAKIWQITETYSPQSFSAKEVVAAPAIVIA